MEATVKYDSLFSEDQKKILSALRKIFEAFHRYDAFLYRSDFKEEERDKGVLRERCFLNKRIPDPNPFPNLLNLYNHYFLKTSREGLLKYFYPEESQENERKQQVMLWAAFETTMMSQPLLRELSMETLQKECEEFKKLLQERRSEVRGQAVGAYVGSFFLGLGMAAFIAGIIAVIVCMVVFSLDLFVILGIAGLVGGAGAFLKWAGDAFQAGGYAVSCSSHLSRIKEASEGLSTALQAAEQNVNQLAAEQNVNQLAAEQNVNQCGLPVTIAPRQMDAQRNAYLWRLGFQSKTQQSQSSTADVGAQGAVPARRTS